LPWLERSIMAAKRKRQEDGGPAETEGSVLNRETQRRAHANSDAEAGSDTHQTLETPTKPRRGRPPGSSQKSKRLPNGIGSTADLRTPSKPKRKSLFSTPVKERSYVNEETGAPIVQNADRSARRKSARTLIEPTAANGLSSEEDDLEEEDLIARKIWEADEGEGGEEQDEPWDELGIESATPATHSKRKRGRRKKSPTPPQNLPPHEQYFWQNRPGKVKTSNNTLSSLSLLTHEQYYDQISAYEDRHESSYDYLHSLHSLAFPQWRFELSQSFNICLYGYGSKRKLVTAFANDLYSRLLADPPKIIVVNGYNQTLTLRTLLTTLATLIFNCTPDTLPPKLGSQPRETLSIILDHLHNHPPRANSPYHIFINSLDAPSLRRSPNPSLLARLGACPHIRLLATCDTPNFPLLWSTALRDQYNFCFHDTTTYLSYAGAEIPSVIDSVNELLGRSGRSVKGKEGVGFVLRSLPENARSLYRVLIAEVLAAMDDEDGGVGGEGGVEYRVLYQKVIEEFICSNEMGFRQLLKEFYDHQMVISKRDGTGAELLGVPWRREEMEAILEDLVG